MENARKFIERKSLRKGAPKAKQKRTSYAFKTSVDIRNIIQQALAGTLTGLQHGWSALGYARKVFCQLLGFHISLKQKLFFPRHRQCLLLAQLPQLAALHTKRKEIYFGCCLTTSHTVRAVFTASSAASINPPATASPHENNSSNETNSFWDTLAPSFFMVIRK